MTIYAYLKDQIARCEAVAQAATNGSTQANMFSMRDAYQDVLDHLTVEDASKEVVGSK